MKNPEKDNKCNILYKHFNSYLCKNATYTVQIIEVLEGTGRDNNKNVDKEITKIRMQKETEWMLKLRTVYPYGLNDRIGNEYRSTLSSSIASRFPKLERKHQRGSRVRSTRKINSHIDIILELSSVLHGNIKNAMNTIRLLLESKTKRILKYFVTTINDFLERQSENFPYTSWYLAALDTIEFKLYKPETPKCKKKAPNSIIKILFENKSLDFINIQKIINLDDVVSTLPKKIKSFNPVVVYTLKPSIRSKIFNYKNFISDITVSDDLSTYPCFCNGSSFVDKDHGHIVTGDLRIVQNNKLRKIFVKGPKYREPSLIDFEKAKDCIDKGLSEFIKLSSNKFKIDKGELSE